MSLRPALVLLALALAAGPLRAQSADEQAALGLADQAGAAAMPVAAGGRVWQGHVELVAGRERLRNAGSGTAPPDRTLQRQSLVLQAEQRAAAHGRWVAAARLDHSHPPQAPYPEALLSLQEAYVAWQPAPDLLLDLGRVNARQGLGTGYNPTDGLRAGALRAQVSVDPASVKTNRLGTVMLRAQQLWDGGALTALAAPKLAAAPSRTGLAVDLGATNDRSRWQLAVSQRLSENLQPQLLLAGADGQAPQLGLNLSSLVGRAGLVYGEWAGGRGADQLDQALATRGAPRPWQQRLATGARYTTARKLSLTVEWAHDSAAPGRAAWQQLQAQPAAYAAYRRWAHAAQELTTRRQWAVYAHWPDLPGAPHLDLQALLRHNPDDHSQLAWLELRYRWPGIDLALQWQTTRGRPGSEYGTLPQAGGWQVAVRGYF